ncbi:MAG: TRAP transporter large permease subunit [Planctomycetales bacterium]|nr:TRAP transporter large permease subunit [Planctomycetales bacterium]
MGGGGSPVSGEARPAGAFRGLATLLRRAEDGLAAGALLLMAALPVLELLLRKTVGTGIPGSIGYVENLTLWVAFLGAMVASREKGHLSLSTGVQFLPAPWKRVTATAAALASVAVATGLAWASLELVKATMPSPMAIAGWLREWHVQLVLPVSFAVMALRFAWHAGGWPERGVAALGIPLAWVVGFPLAGHASALLLPGLLALIAVAFLGAPIFVALGGSALLLFFADEVAVSAVPSDTFSLVTSSSIPMIPLFTLAGFLLAEGGSSRRLLRLFRALFGWLPGGLPVVAALVCAFFTAFTGASGVTILALGGLLLPVLLESGYRERFSVGLLTATGSIGLLFPPSLPVILYAVTGRIPIPDLFRAAFLPGILLLATVSAFGLVEAVRSRAPRPRFDVREAGRALREAAWEVALPFVPLVAMFGIPGLLSGFCGQVEAAALTVAYALAIETVVHRDLHPLRDIPRVVVRCLTLLGGILVILGVAKGLTNYLVDAEIPMHATEWVRAHIESRWVFLLALNVFLLVVGCVMDIFSAIVVVVPLIVPVAAAFQVHPVHLGVIFLANLELGYLTPPVGLNLFLASYRFGRPLLQVARDTLPFLLALLGAVLVITYAPGLLGLSGLPPVPTGRGG